MEPIDLVYTWVNPEGLALAQERRRLAKLVDGKEIDWRAGDARTRDNGEIVYSIESSLRNLNFIRRIYVFGAGGRPSWLPTDTDKMRFVAQESVIPAGLWPTFSSDGVEVHIHKIPDLSEKYLYSNDDFFFSAPHSENDFFTSDGRCITAVSNRNAAIGDLSPTFLEMEINSIRSLNKRLKVHKVIWSPGAPLKQKLKELYRAAQNGIPLANTFSHVTLPYLRSEWAGFNKLFSAEIDQICASPFRSPNGFALNLMYLHYLASRGKAELIVDPRHGYLDRSQSHEEWLTFAQDVQQGRYTRYCLNDAPKSGEDGWAEFVRSLFPRLETVN